MKKILLSSVALLGLATGALAADLPFRRAPAPIIAAVPLFTWTGFYVGVNAGYGWNTNDSITIGGVTLDTNDDGGFIGGGQVGYDYQIGSFVVGLEGDIQYADFGGDDRFDFDGDGIFDNDFDRSDWFGTVRARAGWPSTAPSSTPPVVSPSLTTPRAGPSVVVSSTSPTTCGQGRRSVREPRPGRQQLPGHRQRRRVRRGSRRPELPLRHLLRSVSSETL